MKSSINNLNLVRFAAHELYTSTGLIAHETEKTNRLLADHIHELAQGFLDISGNISTVVEHLQIQEHGNKYDEGGSDFTNQAVLNAHRSIEILGQQLKELIKNNR